VPNLGVEVSDVAVARLVTRLSAEYVLRALQLLITVFGDVRTAIVSQTIATANMTHLDTRHGEGWRYQSIDEPPPEELRRPISIARLSDSLSLPFETTRRVVHHLIDLGMVRQAEGGVVLSMVAAQRLKAVQPMTANVGHVRTFLRDLRAAGFVEHAPAAWERVDTPQYDRSVARIIWRLSAEYVLRAFGLLVETYGDMRDGIIAHTIVTANTSHLNVRVGEGGRYAALNETPADEVRRPITVSRLAVSLGMPFETARRHVRRLTDAGICIRTDGGLIVPQEVLDRPEAAMSALANLRYVRKFVRDLMVIDFEIREHPQQAWLVEP
jgi:DNA-binding Lrp family transcriptional regulator